MHADKDRKDWYEVIKKNHYKELISLEICISYGFTLLKKHLYCFETTLTETTP